MTVASSAYEGPVPAASVVVATHDRAQFLDELLDALSDQEPVSGGFEVVVVDDASSDDAWQVLETQAAETRLRLLCVRSAANVGAGAARSLGIAAARAPVIVFTDDDCLPTKGWLPALVAPLRAGSESAVQALVVQGKTTPWPGDAVAAGAWARTVWVLRPTWLFETCNIAYRAEDLRAVGGFPTGDDAPRTITGRPAGEDALLGWRVVGHGAQLVFRPDALVHHRNFPATFREHLREQRGRAVFPALAARNPMARRAFWGRWFLSPRSAATALALAAAGAAGVTQRPALLVGLVPWVLSAWPEAKTRRGRHPLARLAQLAVADLVGLAATAEASIRSRAVVL